MVTHGMLAASGSTSVKCDSETVKLRILWPNRLGCGTVSRTFSAGKPIQLHSTEGSLGSFEGTFSAGVPCMNRIHPTGNLVSTPFGGRPQ